VITCVIPAHITAHHEGKALRLNLRGDEFAPGKCLENRNFERGKFSHLDRKLAVTSRKEAHSLLASRLGMVLSVDIKSSQQPAIQMIICGI